MIPQTLRISEAASLALHAMVLLARQEGRPLSTRQAAQGLGVSENHLAKVMQRLARAGLVDSRRGPRGGFRLAGGGISLLQVYEAVEGPLASGSPCLLGRPACQGGCALQGLTSLLSHEVRAYLAQTQVRDLARPPLAPPAQAERPGRPSPRGRRL